MKNSPTFISLEHSVIVRAPIGPVYERWCKAEDFPRFMEGVREIAWLSDKRFRLRSESGGELYESICEIALRIPEKRLAWRTIEGPDSSGVACFDRTPDGRTQVTLKVRYDIEASWKDREQVESRLQRNLERFKELIEAPEAAPAPAAG